MVGRILSDYRMLIAWEGRFALAIDISLGVLAGTIAWATLQSVILGALSGAAALLMSVTAAAFSFRF